MVQICNFRHETKFYFSPFAWISDFIPCVVHSEKDRPLKFSLTSVRSDRELRNKFASSPGDEKKGNRGILATFDSIFSEKPNRERESARAEKRNF